MHYLLYLPNDEKSGALKERLTAVGLDDHIDNATSNGCEAGPDGKPGTLLGWTSTASGNTRIEYRADEQEWKASYKTESADAGAYWVGIWTASPPTEGELRRHYTQQGELTEFGSNKEKWKLPTPGSVRRRVSFEAMAADDGSDRWVPVRAMSWLIDEAARYRDEVLDNSREKILTFQWNPHEWAYWVLRLLKVNYHLTPEVADYLELFQDEQVKEGVLKSLELRVVEGEDDG